MVDLIARTAYRFTGTVTVHDSGEVYDGVVASYRHHSASSQIPTVVPTRVALTQPHASLANNAESTEAEAEAWRWWAARCPATWAEAGGLATSRNPFTKDTVCRLLQNHFYRGESPDGNGGWLPATHPPVLDAELFARAPSARAANQSGSVKVTRAHRRHSLSRLGTCGHCGGRLHVLTPRDGKARTDCYQRRQATDCPQPSIHLTVVEEQVAAYLAGFRLPEETVGRVVDLYRQAGEQRDDAEHRRREIGSRLERIAELYGWGDLGRGAYQAERDRLQGELAGLRGAGEWAAALAQAAAFLRDLPAAWEAANQEQRNDLARLVFREVEVRVDRVAAVVPQPDFAPFFVDRRREEGGGNGDTPGGTGGVKPLIEEAEATGVGSARSEPRGPARPRARLLPGLGPRSVPSLLPASGRCARSAPSRSGSQADGRAGIGGALPRRDSEPPLVGRTVRGQPRDGPGRAPAKPPGGRVSAALRRRPGPTAGEPPPSFLTGSLPLGTGRSEKAGKECCPSPPRWWRRAGRGPHRIGAVPAWRSEEVRAVRIGAIRGCARGRRVLINGGSGDVPVRRNRRSPRASGLRTFDEPDGATGHPES